MEGDGLFFRHALEEILKGKVSFDPDAPDTFMVALVAGYTPDYANDRFWDQVSDKELVGAGYVAGGVEVTLDPAGLAYASGAMNVYAADIVWASIDAGVPTHAILWRDGAGSSSGTGDPDLLIACWEVTTPTAGGRYTLQWSDDGMLSLQGSV